MKFSLREVGWLMVDGWMVGWFWAMPSLLLCARYRCALRPDSIISDLSGLDLRCTSSTLLARRRLCLRRNARKIRFAYCADSKLLSIGTIVIYQCGLAHPMPNAAGLNYDNKHRIISQNIILQMQQRRHSLR